MKTQIIIAILFMFVISFANAEIQTLGTVKQNDCIQLVQTYSNSTYTNLTKIQFPNKTIVLSSSPNPIFYFS